MRHFASRAFWDAYQKLPDKAPAQCTMDQVMQKRANLMKLLD